jgi:hypothetical protein
VAVAIRILVCAAAARVRVNLLAHLRFVAHPGRLLRAALVSTGVGGFRFMFCVICPLLFGDDLAPAGDQKPGQDQTKKRR